MQNVQLHNTIWKQYTYAYIYVTISKTVNLIINMYPIYVMLFIAGFFILNTSLTIMVRGMEHKIYK